MKSKERILMKLASFLVVFAAIITPLLASGPLPMPFESLASGADLVVHVDYSGDIVTAEDGGRPLVLPNSGMPITVQVVDVIECSKIRDGFTCPDTVKLASLGGLVPKMAGGKQVYDGNGEPVWLEMDPPEGTIRLPRGESLVYLTELPSMPGYFKLYGEKEGRAEIKEKGGSKYVMLSYYNLDLVGEDAKATAGFKNVQSQREQARREGLPERIGPVPAGPFFREAVPLGQLRSRIDAALAKVQARPLEGGR